MIVPQIGATQTHAIQQLHDQKTATNKLYNDVAIGVGIAVGVVVAVATVAFGVFQLFTLPMVDKVIKENGVDKTIQVPDSPGKVIGCVLLVAGGWAITGLLAGTIAAGIIWLVKIYKIPQLAKKTLVISEKYENNGLIYNDDLEKILKSLNLTRQAALIKEMNFEQLGMAKKTLGDRKFEQVIKSVDKEQHKQWLFLISLSHDTTKKKIEKLSHENIRVIGKLNPFFVQALEDQIQNLHHKELNKILTEYHIPDISKKSTILPKEDDIYLAMEGHPPIKVSQTQISENSGYFRTLLTGKFKESTEKTIQIKEMDNFEDFRLFVDFLNGDFNDLSMETVLRLIPLTNRFSCVRLHTSLDRYIMTHVDQFESKDLINLASTHNLRQTLEHLEQQYLSLKLTPKNFENMWEIATKCNFIELKKKCRDYATTQIKDHLSTKGLYSIPSHTQVQDYFNILESDEKTQLYNTLGNALTMKNFRAIYEFESLNKDIHLKAFCGLYCSSNIQNFKDQMPWDYDHIPYDVFSIVYPTPKLDPTAW